MLYRVLDFVLALALLLCFIPIMLTLFSLGFIFLRSPIFVQTRLGKNENEFTIVKFRSMTMGTTCVPTHLIDSAEISTYGKFLRKSKLDELPQLWNVLKGEMSLVGPRPGLPAQIELTDFRRAHGVFKVRPGITGLAQINKIDMSTPEILARADAEMIRSMSVKNYFKILFLTTLGKGQGDRIQ